MSLRALSEALIGREKGGGEVAYSPGVYVFQCKEGGSLISGLRTNCKFARTLEMSLGQEEGRPNRDQGTGLPLKGLELPALLHSPPTC